MIMIKIIILMMKLAMIGNSNQYFANWNEKSHTTATITHTHTHTRTDTYTHIHTHTHTHTHTMYSEGAMNSMVADLISGRLCGSPYVLLTGSKENSSGTEQHHHNHKLYLASLFLMLQLLSAHAYMTDIFSFFFFFYQHRWILQQAWGWCVAKALNHPFS